MAGTITYNLTINANNNFSNISRNPDYCNVVWEDGKYYAQTETLSSTWKSLNKGDDVVNLGITYLHNIGNNEISVSFDSGSTTHLTLDAGEFQIFRLNPMLDISTVKAMSLSGSNLEYTIFSN